MTFVEWQHGMIEGGLHHLVLKLEAAVSVETDALLAELVRNPRELAENTMAMHLNGWMSGDYGEQLTPEVVFTHRPIVVQAWAIAEVLTTVAGASMVGADVRKAVGA